MNIFNETPVRTSNNFKINNIKLENSKVPENITAFNNLEVENIKLNNKVTDLALKYGTGIELINQIKNFSNQKIRIDITKSEVYKVIFNFDDQNTNLVENIDINIEENVDATLYILYFSNGNNNYWHNGSIRINSHKNSKFNIIIVNLLNTNSDNFLSIENSVEANALLNYTIVDLGGKNSITNLYSNIQGDNAINQINTIYLGKEEQLFDLNYIAELYGKNSNANIEVQGALNDKATKHFKGTIDFKKGCKKATGNENENCILLSDTAKSLALPMLLCSEEDVEGNHSSSAGKIDDKELFYIMSRGFDKKEAMKLMVKAKFNKILENIKDENLKDRILEEIDKKLN